MGSRRQPWQERFWRYAQKAGPDECWEWKGCRSPDGYGRLAARDASGTSRVERAHRLSWRLHRGRILNGLCVLHHCDNASCVNPAHLFLGTQADNNRDMCAKGRHAKLTATVVLGMRRRYAAGGVTQTQLAREHGVHRATASLAINGDTWKHLVEESDQ